MEAYRTVFPDRLKVETEATLISTGTELTVLTGGFPQESAWSRYIKYPFIAGYSSVGRIVEVGSEVEGLKVGDRVATKSPHATHAVVEVDQLIKVPKNVGAGDACFHTIASGVMNSVRLAKVSLGESVVVVGLGLLGQTVTIWSRMAGAFPVIAVDLAEERLRLAKASGATASLHADKWNGVRSAVEELTKGRLADKVFEAARNPKVIPKAVGLAKRQGSFVILSSPRGRTALDFHDEVKSPSRIIIGTHFSSQPAHETSYNPWTRKRNTKLFFDLISARVLKIDHLITHRYPWRKASEAYKMLLKDRTKALGVILIFKTP